MDGQLAFELRKACTALIRAYVLHVVWFATMCIFAASQWSQHGLKASVLLTLVTVPPVLLYTVRVHKLCRAIDPKARTVGWVPVLVTTLVLSPFESGLVLPAKNFLVARRLLRAHEEAQSSQPATASEAGNEGVAASSQSCGYQQQDLRVSKNLTLLLALCFAFTGPQTASAQPHDKSADQAAVAQVVESFRTSIINKDKATYMSLFFSDKPEDIGWQFVSEDTRLEHIRKTKPDAIKARQIPRVNFISLIDNVVATEEPREETFSDIIIDTDGEIASVSFDYTFLANGKKTNWGREMWQLIRTEGGWKIFSVIYTIRDQWSAGEATSPSS